MFKTMKRFNYLCLVLFLALSGCVKNPVLYSVTNFSEEIQGHWKGDLKIFGRDGKDIFIPMQLDIQKTDKDSILTWKMIYDKQPPRNYQLHIRDKAKGQYHVDEQNGIIIPARLAGNELVSNYEVMGNHMTVIYDLRNKDYLLFKVNMWKTNSGKISGDTIINGDTIPKVTSFLPLAYQTAILRKK